MDVKEGDLETDILYSMVTRIASLLDVGFGKHGTKTIAQYLTPSGAINTSYPGNKVRTRATVRLCVCLVGVCVCGGGWVMYGAKVATLCTQ